MAKWSEGANDAIEAIAKRYNLSSVEKSSMHSKINKWADAVGKWRQNKFTIGNYVITATAENGEVLNVEVDM